MESVTPPATAGSTPPAPLGVWSGPAQRATAALVGLAIAYALGLATAMFGSQALNALGVGSKPTELERNTYRVDLNRASRAELQQLPGVGANTAERIEDYRRVNGPFRSVEQLAEVQGIGPTTMERLRPRLTVQPDDTEAVDVRQLPPLERLEPMRREGPGTTAKASSPKKVANLKGPININLASEQELQALPGIGPKMSQRIVDERAKKPFRNVDDLRRVPGIGPKTMDNLRPYITVGNISERDGLADASGPR